MSESSLYKELGILTKKKDQWEENIPYISSLLSHDSVKIQAKALWLLAEMGLAYPQSVRDSVPAIVSFLNSSVPLLRERALNAIGRIGRGDYRLVEPYPFTSKLTSCSHRRQQPVHIDASNPFTSTRVNEMLVQLVHIENCTLSARKNAPSPGQIVNIHRHSRWLFICGHSPRTLACALAGANTVCHLRGRLFWSPVNGLFNYLPFWLPVNGLSFAFPSIVICSPMRSSSS